MDIGDDGQPYYPINELASCIINTIPEYVFAQYENPEIPQTDTVEKLREAARSIYTVSYTHLDVYKRQVYYSGELVVEEGRMVNFEPPRVTAALRERVYGAFQLLPVEHFHIEAQGCRRCRVIQLKKGELLTDRCV